jgi:hypothetical protein
MLQSQHTGKVIYRAKSACAAMVQEAPLKIYSRGVVFFFSARRARAENKANQQCHFKSSRCCMELDMELLDTDSCRGTDPMEPLMSNSSMQHQNPDLDFDDTRIILHGASCTIAAKSLAKSACGQSERSSR